VVRDAVPLTNRGWPPWLPWNALTGFSGLSRRFGEELRRIAPDVVHAHGTESAYALSGIRSGLPCLISIQGVVSEYMKITPWLGGGLAAVWERQAVQRNRWFTCRTNFDAGFVHSVNPQAHIFMIHEAMNRVFFEDQWRLSEAPVILFVGSSEKRKGLDVLLRAMAEVRREWPAVRLKVVGGGDYAPARELCQQLRLEEAVEFMGFQTAEGIARCHREAQLFVLPSRIENSPNTLAEAMVSGMPVVAMAVGGVPSLVEDGRNGVLVPVGDPVRLARAVAELLKDFGKRAALGREARAIARQRHWPETVAGQTVQAYREIIEACRGTG